MKNTLKRCVLGCLSPVVLCVPALSGSASAQTPEKVNAAPFVIPALREWKGTTGKLVLAKKVTLVVDPASAEALTPYVQTFLNDLKLARPETAFSIRKGRAAKGDIYFTLNNASTDLKSEGYRLDISDSVRIEAKEPRGAFWATRSLLQILEQDSAHNSFPKGSAKDYPQFPLRGFVLDVGRKFFSINFLRDYVRFMSYYKMNDFQIHLNDNGFRQFFNNDWDATYSAFRLQNDTYPGLTAKDGSYSKKEFIDLQLLAQSYGVNIVPEIDAPAHSLAFVKAVPAIGSNKYGRDHLDISNPLTYEVLDNVFKEYLAGPNPVFLGPDVHIGTDEYAKAETEKFREFTDHYIRYVEGYGKKARLWGALTHAAGTTPVKSKDVAMNVWNNGYADPKEMLAQGYNVISTPDGWLYIVPKAGYYYDYLNLRNIYDKWTPNIVGNQTFDETLPQILGGSFAVWNDHVGNGITEKDVNDRVFPAMQVLAQKMWLGTSAIAHVDYDDFSRQSPRIGEGAGLNMRGKVTGKSPLVLRYDFNGNTVRDESEDKRQGTRVSGADVVQYQGKKALHLKNGSYLQTPLPGIGYGYTVSFFVNPDEGNTADAVLFSSPDAVVKLKQQATGKLGFSRENYNYNFNYQVPTNRWTHITICGDNEGTTLYANGVLIESLKGAMNEFASTKSKIAKVQTLFFPLQYVGSKSNGFNGYIDDLKVFNKVLSPQNIANLANLRPLEPEAEPVVAAKWKSGQIGDTWSQQQWDITPQIIGAATIEAKFLYSSGEHRLDIGWVELLQNGQVVARDEHPGFTGGATKDNIYSLKLPRFVTGAKYTLRANVRADGGNDSNGDIWITVLPPSAR